jgi:hypothetical protein
MATHYRRVAEVNSGRGRRAMMGADAAGNGEGDVRQLGVTDLHALLLVRHGDPQRYARMLYCGPGIDSLPPALQPGAAECMDSPEGHYRALSIANDGARLARMQARERATTGEWYYPPYDTHIALAWETFRFRAPNGGVEVIAAASVSALSAMALRNRRGEVAARMTIHLTDTVAGSVQRADTVQRFRTGPLAPDARVLLHGTLTASPGHALALRVAVESEDRLAGRIVRGEIDVPQFDSDSLAMSDLVLAPLDGRPSFERGAVRLSLAPRRTFDTGESFTMYYEVYGLEEGEQYVTSIVVEPVGEGFRDRVASLLGRGKAEVRLQFREQAPQPDAIYGVQQTRTVDTSALMPGTWRLRVEITSGDGRASTRERILENDG